MKYKIVLGFAFVTPLLVALVATFMLYIKGKGPSLMPPANRALLTYSRNGGFVGYCDTLDIYQNGEYTYTESCKGDAPHVGLLAGEYLDEIKHLELEIGRLSYGMRQEFADGISEQTDFMGKGADTSVQSEERVHDYVIRVIIAIKNGTISEVLPTTLPTGAQEVPEGAPYYPSTAFYNSIGQVWLDIPEDLFTTPFFTLLIKDRYQEETESYRIPLEGYDMADLPMISPTKAYGCVAVSASGHYGYYIFTLPEGKKISIGPQYSQCIEWVDGNRVFINEKKYDTSEHNYFIFDALTGIKTRIGGYLE